MLSEFLPNIWFKSNPRARRRPSRMTDASRRVIVYDGLGKVGITTASLRGACGDAANQDSNMNVGASETGSTSQSLLRRAQQQDPDAWQRLSRLYAPLVYGWARRAGLQSSDAADLGQEVFRTVASRIGDYRRDGGSGFRAWLWGIARIKLKEHARRRAAEPQPIGGTNALLGEVPEAESAVFQKVEPQSRLVQRALEVIQVEFEEKTWQAFWRSAVDEQRTSNIADDLQMTPKAVRQAKYRVLRRVRQELAELD
jgi:RNA polymerase sigma-70 factor (ECF subfamily)